MAYFTSFEVRVCHLMEAYMRAQIRSGSWWLQMSRGRCLSRTSQNCLLFGSGVFEANLMS